VIKTPVKASKECITMTLDKNILREALAHYQAWNEAKFTDRVRRAGQKSQEQKWREYLALMEFGLQIRPQPSKSQQRRKVEVLERYYRLIQQFEKRRGQGGQSAQEGSN
jgi:hypothetical protein